MQDLWITSPTGGRILALVNDSRPAWLWSADGESLVWYNEAARHYGRRSGKRGHRALGTAVPIRGQVTRLFRLGTRDRSSLARIQFLVGDRPVSATCSCTPLDLPGGGGGLLIVGVDPVEERGELAAEWPRLEALGLAGRAVALVSADGERAAGSPSLTPHATRLASLPLGPDGGRLDIFEPAADAAAMVEAATPGDANSGAEPALPLGLPPIEPSPHSAPDTSEESEDWVEPIAERDTSLSSLFDRLVDDSALFEPIDTHADDPAPTVADVMTDAGPPEDEGADAADDGEDHEDDRPAALVSPEPGLPPPTPDNVERVSRYNFDELSRILTDRVGQDAGTAAQREAVAGRGLRLVTPSAQPAAEGALVNLGSETLVLNRLPLGILVFRDQQVLFANRAITEMIGYDSVDSLRQAGLGAIFPAAADEPQSAGPVNHLVQRDGTLVPVTARLQSIAWQGRPALMLSASTTEVRTGHEAAVRAFAEMLAEIRGDGFVEATRNGMISGVSAAATQMIGRSVAQIVGKPLLALVADSEDHALRAFLERPARFAETARPVLVAESSLPDTEMQLYAQGQAGLVTGYFGFLHRKGPDARPALPATGDIDPALLGRLSRGVRRPLNTIIGFSDLIRSSAFGAIENPRYLEYARDIQTAGQEIAALVDELDDYARLKDGRYQPRAAEIDLTALLESCVVRIRAQAGAGRVLVRSAISETLPRVRADRASLGQAVLNLLSSAIDQTPAGGSVVLSAHLEDGGSILVHVREQGVGRGDLGESFVIFRDGVGTDGRSLGPVRSSVGLALTRSLLEVNAASLSVEPTGADGTIFSLRLPPETVIRD